MNERIASGATSLLTGGDWMTLAVGIVASVVAVMSYLASRRSAAAAEEQVKIAGIQADAAKVQADAARVQAEAAQVQARAAVDALGQEARWRRQDHEAAQPRFVVRVTPTWRFRAHGRDEREPTLSDVFVLIENASSREATVNHIALGDADGPLVQLDSSMIGAEFPLRLESGHQLSFALPPAEFYGFFDHEDDDPPLDELDFVVYVSRSPLLTNRPSEVEHWSSRPFRVRRPGNHT